MLTRLTALVALFQEKPFILIESIHLKKTQQKKMPYSTVPSCSIGRLAVYSTQQRKNLGALLVVDAMKKAYSASFAVGVNALFVEAANEKAVNFYEGLGFKLLKRSNPTANQCLFYPTSGIAELP